MLNCQSTQKLQLTTSATADIHVHVSWVDQDPAGFGTSTEFTPGVTNTLIVTSTTTDIMASPGSGKTRNAKLLIIRNRHATDPNTVTLLILDSAGADPELDSLTLFAGEKLVIREGNWTHYDASGSVIAAAQVSAPITVRALTGDQSNSTTTAAILAGLSIPLGVGTYQIRYGIVYQSSITTTGVKFSVNFSGTVTQFVANMHGCDNLATAASGAADQDALAATGQVYFVFAARAKSATANWGPTVSVDTANVDMFMVIDVKMIVTVAGNLELYHASETAAATTVKAGTDVVVFKTL